MCVSRSRWQPIPFRGFDCSAHSKFMSYHAAYFYQINIFKYKAHIMKLFVSESSPLSFSFNYFQLKFLYLLNSKNQFLRRRIK
jgi:hypothetical protein